MSTSQDQTSNCHFRRPNTPHSTEPEWIPIRMSTSCFVLDLTYLLTWRHMHKARVGTLGLGSSPILPNSAGSSYLVDGNDRQPGDDHLQDHLQQRGAQAGQDGPGERQWQHAVGGEQREEDVADAITQKPIAEACCQDLGGHGHPSDHTAVLQALAPVLGRCRARTLVGRSAHGLREPSAMKQGVSFPSPPQPPPHPTTTTRASFGETSSRAANAETASSQSLSYPHPEGWGARPPSAAHTKFLPADSRGRETGTRGTHCQPPAAAPVSRPLDSAPGAKRSGRSPEPGCRWRSRGGRHLRHRERLRLQPAGPGP
ncbi:uncharacterized protein [Canis lupus baileyi]|uniref:uncharacterized protein LOC112662531 n=1 Tax=Canis lupus dingo TaxID=286419 RepID=UPI000DC745EC|nr:uncharacterized protein LOC112662531 [Canis lupus dingo]